MSLSFVSCNKKDEVKSTIDKSQVTSQRSIEETDKEHSKKLTKIGEILVTDPNSVIEANKLFKLAIDLDSKNDKARFYLAITGIAKHYKGALKKGKKLLDYKHKKIVKEIRRTQNTPLLLNFLMGDSSVVEMDSFEEVRSMVSNDIIVSMDKAIEMLDVIESDITLKTINKNNDYYSCERVFEDGEYFFKCDVEKNDSLKKDKRTVKIDRHDIKLLVGSLGTYNMLLKLVGAYNLEGYESIKEEKESFQLENQRSMTKKEDTELLRKYDNYLTLKKDHKLGDIIKDANKSIVYGMNRRALEERVCDDSRRKHLFKAVCPSLETIKILDSALEFISGPVETRIGVDKNNNAIKILVDLRSYLINPIVDLKSTLPTEFNDDGDSKQITVTSELNVLFPNEDLQEKINLLK